MKTRTIEMPSDSQFAIAMKNQKEAERAEQQRIKNLVLNYDLQGSGTEQSGTDNDLYFDPFLQPNPNILPITIAHNSRHEGLAGERHQHNASLQQTMANHGNARAADKSGPNRSGQRARKLQLSDVDWYDRGTGSPRRSQGRGRPREPKRTIIS